MSGERERERERERQRKLRIGLNSILGGEIEKEFEK